MPPMRSNRERSLNSNSYYWCGTSHIQTALTRNDPTCLARLEAFRALLEDDGVARGVASCEGGEEGVTPHIQFYIAFSSKKRFLTVKQWFQTKLGAFIGNEVHLEARRGSEEEAWAYCLKEGGASHAVGFPIVSQQGKRSDLVRCTDLIKGGANMKELADLHPETVVRYSGGLVNLISLIKSPRSTMTKCLWLFGSTGMGKSLSAQLLAMQFASTFHKSDMTWWWCGYQGEECVIWNDFRLTAQSTPKSISWFLNLIDRYPHKVQVKGGSMEFTSKIVIVTAPESVERTFEGVAGSGEGNVLAQLRRRISQIECTRAHLEAALAWNTAQERPSGFLADF